MTSEPEVAWPLEAQLGEGPVWVERDEALWFVDIKKQLIHRFDPANGATQIGTSGMTKGHGLA